MSRYGNSCTRCAPKAGSRISVASALLFALLPTCPACLAAYATFLAALGMSATLLTGLRICLSLLLIVSALYLVRGALRTRRHWRAIWIATGTVLILAGWLTSIPALLNAIAVACIAIGALPGVRSNVASPSKHALPLEGETHA